MDSTESTSRAPLGLSEILDIPGNAEVFRWLVAQLDTPLGLVPFVGAGLSIPCGKPGWGSFLTASAPQEKRTDVATLIDRGAFEEAADIVLESLGRPAFDDCIEASFCDSSSAFRGPVLYLPTIARGPVITTNIDDVLEQVFKSAGKPFDACVWGAKPDMLRRALHSDSRYLIKVHGDALDRADRILTLLEYEEHYGARDATTVALSRPLPQLLEQAFGSRTLLFLGCSLRADRTVGLLRRVAARPGSPRHYAICEQPVSPIDAAERARFLAEHNIRVIWYPFSAHDAVDVILAELARRIAATRVQRDVNGRVSQPIPRYADDATRVLSESLERARDRRKVLAGIGATTKEVDDEILDLRRKLRDGGQLREGDSLGDGRFLLIERLVRGGFGQVWKAFDRNAKEFVAAKVLHTAFGREPARQERFYRGARIMAGFNHPNVVRVIEPCAEDHGYHYFVMELLPNDLEKRVLRRQLKHEQLIPVVLGIADALGEAHARNIIHRDVKPANILLDAEDAPKLADFDLVRAADTTGGTRTGALGTFLYSAPECMEHPENADARADVWSLGMTAIFAFHGKALPPSVFGSGPAFVDKLDCDRRVRNVLRRAIQWGAAERYLNAAEFAFALRQASIPEAKRVDAARPMPRASPRREREGSAIATELPHGEVARGEGSDTTQAKPSRSDTLVRLQALCRGEISAEETYKHALDSGVLARFTDLLRLCQSSHQSRADILRRQIAALGGMPPVSSGAWSSFVKIVDGAATALSDKDAIAVLEQGEDRGIHHYRLRMIGLDLGSHALVREHLLPQQVETHRIVSTLIHSLF